MTAVTTELLRRSADAEYRRGEQIGAARTIVRLLKRTDLPAISSWEITEQGLIRGRLLLEDGSRQAAIDAVRAVRQVHGGIAVLRQPSGRGRELGVRFSCELRRLELWAPVRSTKFTARV
ncbi:hypothetical protein [Streptomyces sp. NBC_01304]|uniref:hypothetical protein n=1 Tax=Streptomyces sp. NBC_01304 TaxID=2903818 RepID=UPI002E141752|nr:hypothetical protein OG430_48940 [Streptomyces sp. NBC_01304]